MEREFLERARIFKAFCDEKRLLILSILQSGEKCACELIERTGIAQSALSYHMKILCESKVVASRQDGKWTHYSISEFGVERAQRELEMMTVVKEGESCGCK
ncbi:MAG: ArsR/SmtB family transcription factor [Lentisphaeria bacterium]